jgi:hypothetical protein
VNRADDADVEINMSNAVDGSEDADVKYIYHADDADAADATINTSPSLADAADDKMGPSFSSDGTDDKSKQVTLRSTKIGKMRLQSELENNNRVTISVTLTVLR